MAYIYQEQGHKIVGNSDNSVSPHLKAWLVQDNICVCGVIGEGSSLTLANNYESPFEQDSAGSVFEKVGGLLQTTTGLTSKTTLNSAQVWNGTQPLELTLNLELYSLSDPKSEVEDAIHHLKKFASPEIHEILPMGRIPQTTSVSIGRNFIYPEMLISSITEPFDELRDSNGHRIKAKISLVLETPRTINKNEMDTMQG